MEVVRGAADAAQRERPVFGGRAGRAPPARGSRENILQGKEVRPCSSHRAAAYVRVLCSRQPIPVCMTRKDLKGELERAISSTYFHQNQGTCV